MKFKRVGKIRSAKLLPTRLFLKIDIIGNKKYLSGIKMGSSFRTRWSLLFTTPGCHTHQKFYLKF